MNAHQTKCWEPADPQDAGSHGVGGSMHGTLRHEERPFEAHQAEGGAEMRAAPRFTLLIRAAKLVGASGEFLCVIRDASETGISVRLFHPLPPGDDLTLEMPSGDRHALERVWEEDGKAGFRFRQRVPLGRIVEDRGSYAKRPVRVRLEVPCTLLLGDRRVHGMIGNLSQHGALVRSDERLSLAQRVRIVADGLPEIAARVRWRRDDRYGLSFEDSLQFGQLAALAFDLQREAAATS